MIINKVFIQFKIQIEDSMGPATGKPIDFSLNHPKFNNSRLVVNGKQRIMQTDIGTDSKAYEAWKNRLQKANISHQFLLLPIKEEFSSKGLCGSSGNLTLDFDDYPYLLTQEIANRKGKKKLFAENELWYLLFALISAKKSIDPSFSKIGDVRPHNIFINDQGQIKISNVYSWPHQTTNYSKTFNDQITYLAPEELRQLEQGALENEHNSDSELFSIGLTLLSAGTLQDFTNNYDIKKHTLDQVQIIQKLNQFRLNRAYSDILKGVVCNLCQFDETRRVNSKELWTWIQPHEKSIKARQNFFIPSAPQKIHQQVAVVRKFISHHLGEKIPAQNYVARQSLSGQKLNFPPPIIRTSAPPEVSPVAHTYTGFSNPLIFNAQSTYIPASKANVGEQAGQITTKITTENKVAGSNQKVITQTKVENSASDKKN